MLSYPFGDLPCLISRSLRHDVQWLDSPVAGLVRAGVVHPYDDEDVLKVRANVPWSEGVSTWLLEHNGHDVVPNVAFPQQLEKKSTIVII